MHIELIREGAIATVRLNRPDALNALSEPMKDELGTHFAELARDYPATKDAGAQRVHGFLIHRRAASGSRRDRKNLCGLW